ncbi:DUF1232 domain-containing protein [Rubrobacter indicoceani]|uniref:YkvA family protein n=1 Tax=Rubrobacter indicoceani TaxID=2051957 RepID=UPI000E5A5D23
MSALSGWKRRILVLKREVLALAFAAGHPGTPLAAKLLAFIVVAYALSPIDLIPDFIPVLGLLDDLVLLPLGILLVRRMIPREVLDECRERTGPDDVERGPFARSGALIVVSVWVSVLAVVVVLGSRTASR